MVLALVETATRSTTIEPGVTIADHVSELKSLSKDAIPGALEKAVRYRLLNEPGEAESICLDILKAQPDNQEALRLLVLALTDRFSRGYAVGDSQAQEVVGRLDNDYERTYYSGIICERRAKAYLHLATGG